MNIKILAATKILIMCRFYENKGSVMGASNPHPHGQIWAQKTIRSQFDLLDISYP